MTEKLAQENENLKKELEKVIKERDDARKKNNITGNLMLLHLNILKFVKKNFAKDFLKPIIYGDSVLKMWQEFLSGTPSFSLENIWSPTINVILAPSPSDDEKEIITMLMKLLYNVLASNIKNNKKILLDNWEIIDVKSFETKENFFVKDSSTPYMLIRLKNGEFPPVDLKICAWVILKESVHYALFSKKSLCMTADGEFGTLNSYFTVTDSNYKVCDVLENIIRGETYDGINIRSIIKGTDTTSKDFEGLLRILYFGGERSDGDKMVSYGNVTLYPSITYETKEKCEFTLIDPPYYKIAVKCRCVPGTSINDKLHNVSIMYLFAYWSDESNEDCPICSSSEKQRTWVDLEFKDLPKSAKKDVFEYPQKIKNKIENIKGVDNLKDIEAFVDGLWYSDNTDDVGDVGDVGDMGDIKQKKDVCGNDLNNYSMASKCSEKAQDFIKDIMNGSLKYADILKNQKNKNSNKNDTQMS